MKKIMLISIFLTSGAFVTAQITPGINITQKSQANKIKQGFKSGQLTVNEFQKLMLQQKLIQLQKSMIKADGVVTSLERTRLKNNLSRAKEAIYIHKQD